MDIYEQRELIEKHLEWLGYDWSAYTINPDVLDNTLVSKVLLNTTTVVRPITVCIKIEDEGE